MADLLTFDAAQQWLRSRVNVPTALGSGELALQPDFPAQVRAHAFFSAKVTSANVLNALRGEVDSFVQGETDIASARMRLKTFLSRQGVAPDDVATSEKPPAGMSEADWKAAKRISNLASTRRLDLILRQNAGMANAIGQRQVSEDPAVVERWPYYRYITGPNPRDSHAALDGLVLPKDDPFWNTHTPPWDFNCNCSIEDCDAEEAAQYGGVGKAVVKELPDGGQQATVVNGSGQTANLPGGQDFVFRPDQAFTEPDWSLIQDGNLRAFVRAGYHAKVGKVPAPPPAPAVPLPPTTAPVAVPSAAVPAASATLQDSLTLAGLDLAKPATSSQISRFLADLKEDKPADAKAKVLAITGAAKAGSAAGITRQKIEQTMQAYVDHLPPAVVAGLPEITIRVRKSISGALGQYSQGARVLALNAADLAGSPALFRKVLFHELSHWVHDHGPQQFRDSIRAFYASRTAGENLVMLKPHGSRGRRDLWADYTGDEYAGRIYKWEDPAKPRGYEVVTRHLEKLTLPPDDFLRHWNHLSVKGTYAWREAFIESAKVLYP